MTTPDDDEPRVVPQTAAELNLRARRPRRSYYMPSPRRMTEAAVWLATLCLLVEADIWLSARI